MQYKLTESKEGFAKWGNVFSWFLLKYLYLSYFKSTVDAPSLSQFPHFRGIKSIQKNRQSPPRVVGTRIKTNKWSSKDDIEHSLSIKGKEKLIEAVSNDLSTNNIYNEILRHPLINLLTQSRMKRLVCLWVMHSLSKAVSNSNAEVIQNN